MVHPEPARYFHSRDFHAVLSKGSWNTWTLLLLETGYKEQRRLEHFYGIRQSGIRQSSTYGFPPGRYLREDMQQVLRLS